MAKQNANPPKWDRSKSDGGSWIPGNLKAFGGDASDVFYDHDEDYWNGGSWWQKVRADARMAWGLMKKPLAWKLISIPAFIVVSTLGIAHWNWLGSTK